METGMARLGAFCFPGTGHINPMTALARALQRRGHQVVIYGIADCEARVRAAGVEFCQIGAEDYPPGTLRKSIGTVSSRPLTVNFQVDVVRPELRLLVEKIPFPDPTNTRSELKGSITSAPAQ